MSALLLLLVLDVVALRVTEIRARGGLRVLPTIFLTRLRNEKRTVWFNAPVEVERVGLHDYHTVIKHPMDLAAGRYASRDEFAADVRLTFTNALRYALLAYFERMYKEALPCFEEDCKRLEPPKTVPTELAPSPTAEPVEAKVQPRGRNVRMQKPKAREPNKGEDHAQGGAGEFAEREDA